MKSRFIMFTDCVLKFLFVYDTFYQSTPNVGGGLYEETTIYAGKVAGRS